jgi:uncharacterized membrane protein YfcA
VSLAAFELIMFFLAIFAGGFGALLGLGGGAIIVPALAILFHVDIRLAIGASIISVIATSSGAAVAYLRDNKLNLKVALFLEIGTTLGALTGAFLTTVLPTKILYILFAILLLYSGLEMLIKKKNHALLQEASNDIIAEKLELHDLYVDGEEKKTYYVTNSKFGLLLMYIAGLMSALLGIGSGALKVPAMDLVMKLPLKVSTATSNFMIGVTAAASAGVYFERGLINPFIAAPIAIGILLGAGIGTRILPKISDNKLRYFFVTVLLLISVEMIIKAI